ncbi:MAG: hypothetical protein WC789_03025 [Lentisphaeria bacterium]|jgi:hypothetical protein
MSASRTPKPPRVHKHTLVEMNVPVYRARRDAALARALEILRRDLETGDEKHRLAVYARCERLLDEAIHATRRTLLSHDAPFLRYLQILHDTVGLNHVLLRHAHVLAKETKQLAQFMQTQTAELREIDNDFCVSEKQLRLCIGRLLAFGEPLMSREADDRQQRLHPDDLRRYDLARREYDAYYRHAELPAAAPPAPDGRALAKSLAGC